MKALFIPFLFVVLFITTSTTLSAQRIPAEFNAAEALPCETFLTAFPGTTRVYINKHFGGKNVNMKHYFRRFGEKQYYILEDSLETGEYFTTPKQMMLGEHVYLVTSQSKSDCYELVKMDVNLTKKAIPTFRKEQELHCEPEN